MPDPTIPAGEPESFVRGDLVRWTRGISPYLPTEDWVLTYHLVHPEQKKTIVGTDNGDGTWQAEILAADSGAYVPGSEWAWQAVISKVATLEVYTEDEGTLTVEEGFGELSAGHDDRSFWARVLEQVEVAIMADAASSETSLSVDGYSAQFETRAELMAYHARVQSRVEYEKAVEKRGRGLGTGNRIGVRF